MQDNNIQYVFVIEEFIKSKFVLICNIDPVIEHCDIIDLWYHKNVSFILEL